MKKAILLLPFLLGACAGNSCKCTGDSVDTVDATADTVDVTADTVAVELTADSLLLD